MPRIKLYLNGYEYDLVEDSERTHQLRERYRAEGWHTEIIALTWNNRPAVLIGDAIYVQGARVYDGVVDWDRRAPRRLGG